MFSVYLPLTTVTVDVLQVSVLSWRLQEALRYLVFQYSVNEIKV
jgi:hypothetical protein